MKQKNSDFHQIFNVKLNFGVVFRVTPTELQKIKTFIESLEDITIVHLQVSGNRLFIKEDGNYDK